MPWEPLFPVLLALLIREIEAAAMRARSGESEYTVEPAVEGTLARFWSGTLLARRLSLFPRARGNCVLRISGQTDATAIINGVNDRIRPDE